jgi:signal transduction histidine kinase
VSESLDELRASRERLVVAADDDRRRIERELHDGVQQHLVALAVNLQLVQRLVDSDPAAAKALLEDLRRDVSQALEEAARLAQKIHPPLLAAGGLAAALRAAASSAGIPISVEVDARGNYPPHITATVYLCWVEALEHAGSHAAITVREDPTTLFFEIEGGGVDRLRDRVESLGGQLVSSDAHVVGSLPL